MVSLSNIAADKEARVPTG